MAKFGVAVITIKKQIIWTKNYVHMLINAFCTQWLKTGNRLYNFHVKIELYCKRLNLRIWARNLERSEYRCSLISFLIIKSWLLLKPLYWCLRPKFEIIFSYLFHIAKSAELNISLVRAGTKWGSYFCSDPVQKLSWCHIIDVKTERFITYVHRNDYLWIMKLK